MKPHIWYVKNFDWWIVSSRSKHIYFAVGNTPLEAYDAWKIRFSN